MNMKEAIKQITGQEPSPEQIQRIMSIAHTLDIPSGDPMLAVMAIMDAYYGSISNVPKSMSEQADKAAKTAANNAQQQVTVAVTNLLGTVSDKISEVAKESISRTQNRADIQTLVAVFAVTCVYTAFVTSFAFLAGMLAQANKTGGALFFPVWMNNTNSMAIMLLRSVLNAPLGYALSAVLTTFFVVRALLSSGTKSYIYSAGAIISASVAMAIAMGAI
jgi:hypothetical protein